jgi:hypothetical protein
VRDVSLVEIGPLLQPDEVDLTETKDEDVRGDYDTEEDVRTSSDRWVSGSGTPGSFCFALGLLWASGACGSRP